MNLPVIAQNDSHANFNGEIENFETADTRENDNLNEVLHCAKFRELVAIVESQDSSIGIIQNLDKDSVVEKKLGNHKNTYHRIFSNFHKNILRDILTTVVSLESSLRISRNLEIEQCLKYSTLISRNVKLQLDLKNAFKRNKTMLNLFRQNVGFGIAAQLPRSLKREIQRTWHEKYDALLKENSQLKKATESMQQIIKEKDGQIDTLQERLLNMADNLLEREDTIRNICIKYLSLKNRKDEQEASLRGIIETLQMELSNFEDTNEGWNILRKTFDNTSSSYNSIVFNNTTRDIANYDFSRENPAKLGIATGLFITCLADFRISNFKNDFSKATKNFENKLQRMAITIFNLTCFCLLAPIISAVLIILYAYRSLVKLILSIKYKNKFVGFLDGTDCVWAIEETTSLSVVNIVAILEKYSQVKLNDSSNEILKNFRILAKSRLLTPKFEKLLYQRKKQYGYFFWLKSSKEIDLENRIRWLHDEHADCDGSCDNFNGVYMKKLLAKTCNDPLPDDHEASWEILIGRTCAKATAGRVRRMEEGRMLRNDNNSSDKTSTPILFRVHHSLGDGVALLSLLLEAIADPKDIVKVHGQKSCKYILDIDRRESDFQDIRIPVPVRTKDGTWNSYNIDISTNCEKDEDAAVKHVKSNADFLSSRKDILSATMPFTSKVAIDIMGKSLKNYFYCYMTFFNDVTMRDISDYLTKLTYEQWIRLREWRDEIFENVTRVYDVMKILTEAPFCLAEQALRSMDNSALHGPKLSGEKILSCWIESDFENKNDETLLYKIRSIKDAIGARFGDVILAALSSSLHRYFLQVNESVPKTITVVLPARMSSSKKELRLENGFSVGLLPLCVRQVNGVCIDVPNGNFRIFERLLDVSRRSEKLRRDLDYRINYWVMTWLSAYLPEFLLKPILESHSTLVFSNLPGPEEIHILGHVLKSIAFWMPHRGSTGIGYSVLSYNGNLHLSLIADKSVIGNEKLLHAILENTVREIENLYDAVTLSCFSKKLHRRVPAPT